MGTIDVTIHGEERLIAELEEWHHSLSGEPVVYAVGSPLHYAIHQEFGTYFHPPQPYLRPAVEYASKNKVGDILEDADNFDKAMNQIAEVVKKEAKNRAPVRTGALRDSINKRKVK